MSLQGLDVSYFWWINPSEFTVSQVTDTPVLHFGDGLSVFCTPEQAAEVRDKLTAHLEAVQYVPPVPAIPGPVDPRDDEEAAFDRAVANAPAPRSTEDDEPF